MRWAERLNADEITPAEFREYKDKLLRREQQSQAALAELEQQPTQAAHRQWDWALVDQALDNADRLWEELTAEERQHVVQEAIEKVIVSRQEDGAVEIRVRPRFHSERVVRVPTFRGPVLTKRQMEVLWLLRQGLTRREAARQLGQSVPGLTATLATARRRLGAETVDQAVAQAQPLLAPFLKWLDLGGRAQRRAGRGRQWPRLSPAETRILQALREGGRGPQIAQNLGISPNTLYVHLHNLREKFGAATNRQLLDSAHQAACLPQQRCTLVFP